MIGILRFVCILALATFMGVLPVAVSNAASSTANPNAELQIGLLQFTPVASNTNRPIFVPTAGAAFTSPVTDTMNLTVGSRTVRIGLSDVAGGYITAVSLSGFGKPAIEQDESGNPKNIDDQGVGKGWQSSIRSYQHNGYYNPTQAGFSDLAGTPVTLVKSSDGKEVDIKQFNVALFWGGGVFDFTGEGAFWKKYLHDLSNDVHLGTLPPGITSQQDAEIRSEFDFAGAYQDISAKFGMPALQHDFAYAYIREPKAMLRFTDHAATGTDGRVLLSQRKAQDVSREEPGEQSLADYDVSPLAVNWKLRVTKDFTVFMWKTNDVWQSIGYSPDQESPNTACWTTSGNTSITRAGGGPFTGQVNGGNVDCPGARNLRIVSTGPDPDHDVAIGLYYPTDQVLNTNQTWIVDRDTMQPLAKEDRRVFTLLRATFKSSSDKRPAGDKFDEKGNLDVGSETTLSGLRSPTTLAAQGYPHSFELYFQRVYVLFGTPNEMYAAVEKFESSHAAYTDEINATPSPLLKVPFISEVNRFITSGIAGTAGNLRSFMDGFFSLTERFVEFISKIKDKLF